MFRDSAGWTLAATTRGTQILHLRDCLPSLLISHQSVVKFVRQCEPGNFNVYMFKCRISIYSKLSLQNSTRNHFTDRKSLITYKVWTVVLVLSGLTTLINHKFNFHLAFFIVEWKNVLLFLCVKRCTYFHQRAALSAYFPQTHVPAYPPCLSLCPFSLLGGNLMMINAAGQVNGSVNLVNIQKGSLHLFHIYA